MSTIGIPHLRLLAVFASAVEAGSFAAAARRLRSSRSRVSEQVAELEYVLGVRLLQRSTRKLKITSEGADVYDHARKLVHILQSVEAVTAPQVPSGRVAITMNHDIAHKYILPVLARFKQQYPDVHLDLVLSDERLDLIDQQIDLAIRIGFPRDDSLVARALHEERFAVFASPEYLSEFGSIRTLKDLENCRWICLTQTGHNSVQRFTRNHKSIEIQPQDFYRCNSPMMLQQMVANGLGVAALLPSTVRLEIENGKLTNVMPSLTSDPLVFYLVYPSRRQVPLRTRVVIDFLTQAGMFG